MNKIIKSINEKYFKTDLPIFNSGDTINVHVKVIEGEKERIQIFKGVVLKRGGSGINENFTVRRISYGVAVERIFPIHSPKIDKIEIIRYGKVRRARLNYLKDRIGKSARIKDRKIIK